MSPTEENNATNRWDTLERVINTVGNWGLAEAETPKVDCPTVSPEMLLTPDVKQYTTMYTAFLHWFNYANKLKARIIAELLQFENEMDDIAAATRKALREQGNILPKKLTAKDIDDEVNTTPRYRELKIRAQELEQLKAEMDARCEELERSLRVVSRNIEVRKEEMGDGRKGENMPGRVNGRGDRFGR
jgi:hypothetical protein